MYPKHRTAGTDSFTGILRTGRFKQTPYASDEILSKVDVHVHQLMITGEVPLKLRPVSKQNPA